MKNLIIDPFRTLFDIHVMDAYTVSCHEALMTGSIGQVVVVDRAREFLEYVLRAGSRVLFVTHIAQAPMQKLVRRHHLPSNGVLFLAGERYVHEMLPRAVKLLREPTASVLFASAASYDVEGAMGTGYDAVGCAWYSQWRPLKGRPRQAVEVKDLYELGRRLIG